jgi:L-histidine N-alpha-methyltransferase
MNPGDTLLLGADLVKDERRLVAAYDDPQGVTAAFNLNVLRILNRELDADFDPARFGHRARFDSEESWIEMLLVAREAHEVVVPALGLRLQFEAGEALRTEVSTKFAPADLQAELSKVGFAMDGFWTDDLGDYSLSLWRR